MNFTFPDKPLRTSLIRTTHNKALIARVLEIKRSGHQDQIRIAA